MKKIKQLVKVLSVCLAALFAMCSFAGCEDLGGMLGGFLGGDSSEETTVTYATEDSEGLEFTLGDDGESYVWSGMGTCKDVNLRIPAEYNGRPVTGINGGYVTGDALVEFLQLSEEEAEEMKKNPEYSSVKVKSIWLPDSITYIDIQAISCSTSLQAIRIGMSVSEIRSPNFMLCSNLNKIDVAEENQYFSAIGGNLYSKDGKILWRGSKQGVAEGTEEIADYAFFGMTAPAYLVLPKTLKKIGRQAFNTCMGLEKLEIQSEVEMDGKTFWQNISLREVILNMEHVPDTLDLADVPRLTLSGKVKSIAEGTLRSFEGVEIYNASALTIGKTDYGLNGEVINIYSPTSIKEEDAYGGVFYEEGGCKLYRYGELFVYDILRYGMRDIVVPDGVETLPKWLFSEGNVRSVSLPVSLTYVEDCAFSESGYNAKVSYRGTMEQWAKVEINVDGYQWLREVECIDGIVKLV